MLIQRINNKQNEFVGRKISAFIGFQVEIAVGLRERQFDIYRSQSVHMPTYAEVRKSFEVLNFIHSNHIHSLDDMRACLAAANHKEDNAMHRYFRLANKKESNIKPQNRKSVTNQDKIAVGQQKMQNAIQIFELLGCDNLANNYRKDYDQLING